MKRKISLFLMLVFVLLLASCDKTIQDTPSAVPTGISQEPTAIPTTDTLPTPSATVTEEGGLSFAKHTKQGSTLTVEVVGNKKTDSQLGVVLLTSEKYLETWKDNPEALIDIGQITLDDDGKGSITLMLSKEDAEYVICITHSGGNYIIRQEEAQS